MKLVEATDVTSGVVLEFDARVVEDDEVAADCPCVR